LSPTPLGRLDPYTYYTSSLPYTLLTPTLF
jgi:hypothetical protein